MTKLIFNENYCYPTDRQVSQFRVAFANNSSVEVKLPKAEIFKVAKPVEFLGRLLSPLLKTGLPLMKNVPKYLARSLLVPLRLTAAVLTTTKCCYLKENSRLRNNNDNFKQRNGIFHENS